MIKELVRRWKAVLGVGFIFLGLPLAHAFIDNDWVRWPTHAALVISALLLFVYSGA